MNIKEQAESLLAEYHLCLQARPKHNAVEVQLEKDSCSNLAVYLNSTIGWGTEEEIVEAYSKLAPKLKQLKEHLVFEILKNGSV